MKKLMILIVLAGLAVGGCQEEEIREVVTLSKETSLMVDELQKNVAHAVEAGIISQEKANKLNAEIDKVQGNQAVIAAALENVEYTEDGVMNIIAGLQAVNTATGSTGLNPYAVPVSVGLNALLGFLAWMKRQEAIKKDKEAAANLAKYTAHKQGVEKTNNDLKAMDEKDITAASVVKLSYDNVGLMRERNNVA